MGNKMLIEFYDSEVLENIVSLISGKYSGVTYVYFRQAGEPDKRECNQLSEFVRSRLGFTPRFLAIPENTIDAALESLSGLVADGFCDIDITGGSAVFIAAAGALQVKLGRERVGIHEYDVSSGKYTFCCPEEFAQFEHGASVTVEELLGLRGIRMLKSGAPIRYRMDAELSGEILRLWEAVRGNLHAWNVLSTCPGNMDETWSGLRAEKRMSSRQFGIVRPLLDKLSKAGILSGLESWNRDGEITVAFRLDVPQSAYVLYQKGGNLLELFTCLAVEKSGHFTDCCVGLMLDWDDRDGQGAFGPYNELDVVATRGYIPCVISCKNTAVENDYLYEIIIMARHFGGKYAIPVMVSTVENKPAIRARAAEMGVVLIDDVGKMTAAEFEKRLCASLCSE